MKDFTKPYIPFLAFLLLLLLSIPFSFDFATSVVPGWHTTIYPPYLVWTLIVVIALLLAAIGYWVLSKRQDKINRTFYVIHIALTIPTVVYLKFPTIFLDANLSDQNELLKALEFRMKLIPITWILFAVGQLLFLIYFIRRIKQTKRSEY